MVDSTLEPDGARLDTVEAIAPLWEKYRVGGCAPCPVDGSPLALSVDGAVDVYRLVCVRCGCASTWFESRPTGLVIVHGADATGPGAR